MNDEETKAFLRKMGYAGSSMKVVEEVIKKRKRKETTGSIDDDLPKGHVYKSDLLNLLPDNTKVYSPISSFESEASVRAEDSGEFYKEDEDEIIKEADDDHRFGCSAYSLSDLKPTI